MKKIQCTMRSCHLARLRNQNVCAGKENILHMAAKYCICATTLNMSGILIVNYYPNIETHTTTQTYIHYRYS